MSIRKGTTIIAGNSSPLDWTGTLQEYNIALENGTIKEHMVCYITDDTLYTDDIRPEIETLNSVKANKDLSNLSEVGEKHFLNKGQITNCITEVPQRVKLEFTDGVITIYKGSQFIVPNGFEVDGTPKFDYMTATQDVTISNWGSNAGDVLVVIDNELMLYADGETHSSTELPTQTNSYVLWYDITENIVKRMYNGTVSRTNLSLPFMIIHRKDGGDIDELKQVFNGFGYIGSTYWVDKGVKCICPNGRNEDGTLKNTEYVNTKICLETLSVSWTAPRQLFISGAHKAGIMRQVSSVSYIQEQEPPIDSELNTLWYKPSENMFRYSTDHLTWNVSNPRMCYIGDFMITGGKVTSLYAKQPFRAIDYNDKSQIVSWGMPSSKYVDLTLGSSGSKYTAPANGWFYLNKTTQDGGYIALDNTTCNFRSFITSRSSATHNISTYIPAKKGDVIVPTYNATGATVAFRFIYAEGEV